MLASKRINPCIIMRNTLIPLVVLLAVLTAGASEPLLLWPQGAPGEKGDIGVEHDTTGPGAGLTDGKRVIRLGNVSVPTITLYRPSLAKDTGAAVIVCPGGGYQILAMDLEGTEVCQWLNSFGVTAVLLKYRVPAREGLEPYTAPLQDAQRTLGLVRSRAAEWKIDPNRIGIMGFSAGGHLSATASTRFAQRTYEQVDAADQVSCRPDFTMLIYPAYLVRDKGPELAPELTVTPNTPPTFLFQTEDDGVHVECSLYYYLALKRAKVPAEMHLFVTGGHGYGLRGPDTAPKSWPKLAEAWLRELGVLKGKKP
jgi:acetyl esterase/lipase